MILSPCLEGYIYMKNGRLVDDRTLDCLAHGSCSINWLTCQLKRLLLCFRGTPVDGYTEPRTQWVEVYVYVATWCPKTLSYFSMSCFSFSLCRQIVSQTQSSPLPQSPLRRLAPTFCCQFIVQKMLTPLHIHSARTQCQSCPHEQGFPCTPGFRKVDLAPT